MAKTKARSAKDHFLQLVQQLPLRPVRNESDLDDAMKMIGELLRIPPRQFTKDHEDYLESLSELVEHYEAEHHRIAPPEPIEFLNHLMEARGMTRSDLGRLLGNRALGSKILRGDRKLSKRHILTLAEYFRVNPGHFLRASENARQAHGERLKRAN